MPNDIPEWARFAPSLSHLLPMITAQEAVICGWSSGPQPQASDFDPAEPQHFSVLVDDPWQTPDHWVTLTADGCRWFEDDGEQWECSHEAFFAYLAQLPRRLHTFGHCAE